MSKFLGTSFVKHFTRWYTSSRYKGHAKMFRAQATIGYKCLEYGRFERGAEVKVMIGGWSKQIHLPGDRLVLLVAASWQ